MSGVVIVIYNCKKYLPIIFSIFFKQNIISLFLILLFFLNLNNI